MKARVLGILTMFVGLLAGAVSARSAEPHWPEALVIGTASPGGTYYDYGEGLARILTRDSGHPGLDAADGRAEREHHASGEWRDPDRVHHDRKRAAGLERQRGLDTGPEVPVHARVVPDV